MEKKTMSLGTIEGLENFWHDSYQNIIFWYIMKYGLTFALKVAEDMRNDLNLKNMDSSVFTDFIKRHSGETC